MRTTRVPFLLIAVVALMASGCLVSKKDFLLKEEEAVRCTDSLRVQVEENRALKTELSRCQDRLSAADKGVEELTAGLSRTSGERDDLQNRLTVQQAVNQELKTQNDRLGDILQKKEVSQTAIIKETMEINKRLQGTNTELREKIAATSTEARQREKDLAATREERDALLAKSQELERQKEAELKKLKATYDELVTSLKGEIEAGEIQISRMKDRLSVNLVEKILFDSGKADLKGSGVEVLRKVGAQLARIKDKRIQIEGHTDNVPIGGRLQERFLTNWELSAGRALAVVHFLQDEVGIDPVNLSAAGYGQYQPAASNESVEGKSANRRIEIVLLPPYERMSEAQETTTGPAN